MNGNQKLGKVGPAATLPFRPLGDSVSAEWRPWAWCNLGRNPFGELTRSERAAVAVVDLDSLTRELRGDRVALQLIGEAGRGKSTRLWAMAEAFPRASYVYLPEQQPCPAIPLGRPLLIDEAQRLSRENLRRVCRSGLPLLLATHRDLERALRRFGYRVRTTVIGVQTDAGLIREIINRRVALSRLAPGPVPEISLDEARQLWERFGSDLRGLEGFLYERVQEQAFGHGEMRFID